MPENIKSSPIAGFTLVELSIALVIIGLLAGGILAARSMIETVRIQRFVKDVGQYDIAVTQFKEAYRKLPGDSPIFSPAGNGDDMVLGADGAGQQNCYGAEMAAFWKHLSDSKFVKDKYTADMTEGIKAGVNMAKLPFGDDVGLFAGTLVAVRYTGSPFAGGQNFYSVRGSQTGDSPYCPAGTPGLDNNTTAQTQPLSGQVAKAIDVKLDDGNPLKGKVMAAVGKEIMASPYFTLVSCMSGVQYNVVSGKCSIAIKMESISEREKEFRL